MSELNLPKAPEVIDAIRHIGVVSRALGMTSVDYDLGTGSDGMNFAELMRIETNEDLTESPAFEGEVMWRIQNMLLQG